MILHRRSVPLLLVGALGGSACAPVADLVTVPADPLYGVANIDDDDEDGEADWDVGPADGEDDRVTLELVGLGDVELTLDGDVDAIRVWRNDKVLLDADTLSDTVTGGTVEIEYGDLLVAGSLTVTPVDAPETGRTLTLGSAPLILNHHLQGAELVVAMSASGSNGNADFIQGFIDVLGSAFTPFELRTYGWDVWVEDEIELATFTAPGHRMDVVIDSIRTNNDRYLDEVAEEEFEAPGTAVRTWGSGRATSQDSFGNLEVSPPVTVDGVEYPFGRIYWGDVNGRGITDELAEVLEAQRVQAPFQVDNTWLCVGHVDEFSTFVPDPTSAKGFRFLYADTDLGRDFLESLDPDTSLPRYRSDHGYATVGDIVEDEALWLSNEDMQRDYLDPNLEIFKRELGLEEEDIIRIPGVFEENAQCGGYALALIPATVNLVIADLGDGVTHALLPDPFLREDDDDLASDPFIAEVESLLPANLTPQWVDDWDWYHIAWGEVHCGSNTRRTPLRDWWTDAAHLLEAE